MNQKVRRKWGLSAEHDLKPNITTEGTFLDGPAPLNPSVGSGSGGGSDTRDEPVSRADMLATVYYRDARMAQPGGTLI